MLGGIMKKYLLILLLVLSSQAFSDDIDLYIKNTAFNVQRPNVLIILDNSGSMGNVNTSGSKANSARGIIIDLINDNSSVDFALQIFNNNSISNRNGGRIIAGFNDLSIPANKTALLDLLDTDTNNTNNNYTKLQESHTPLCEALYETYRYFSGGEVFYGIQNPNSPKSITLSGNYTSPFAGMKCNKEITIIYITDGSATNDTNADNKVKTLTGANNSDKYNSSFLGVLGSWMGKRNWYTPGPSTIADTPKDKIVGSVKIHTVGFGSVTSNTGVVGLLKLAARDGETAVTKTGFHDLPAGGKYHKATSAADLKTALQDVIEEVLDSSSLTSASVSANSLDRTQTLDSVYYGMFEPSTAARWQGNLKKYKIVNGVQVDFNGKAAVNSEGVFDKDAQSFWSLAKDGNDITKGGVAEMLRTTKTSARTLFTDIEGIGSLTEFSYDKIKAKYTTAADRTDLFEIPLAEDSDINDYTDWAMGVDVDDDDKDITTDVRDDVFGDPLHSQPIIINYATGGTRIVVGTNAGVLHMFKDDKVLNTVTESWAYLPKELFKNIKPLRENAITVDNKVYGLDGEIKLYINDLNNDGKVDPGDTAWLFFGLRRGGSSYYALDVTTPDAPKLMWHIEATGDFNELGQTWSTPQVVRSAYNTADTDKLVVIFGGGYDTTKDASGPNTHSDAKGAAVYMVNARTGVRIFKQNTTTNNGIAASIATLDSDNDALVDRLYVGDTGGNLWRVDMPDDTLTNISIVPLASVGGTTDSDDIRFFNKPSIVRTYIIETIDAGTVGVPNIVKQKIPYDAILLGSGDRTTPTDTSTNDMFFMFKDKYINTQRLDNITPAITPITLNELYDYTDDPFKDYPNLTTAQEAKLVDASLASGWHVDLQQTGEKSSAEAIVLSNIVYFTTYTPAPDATCSVTPGDAWLYAIDLALGFKKYDWGTEPDNRSGDDRIIKNGSELLGKPTPISTIFEDPITGEEVLTTGIVINKKLYTGPPPIQTMRTSLTIEEE
jgi:type IV pilus assembly protein PilY1